MAARSASRILVPLLIVFAFSLVWRALPALADYTPPPEVPGLGTVGAGGAKVQNQGTGLNASDAVGAWNWWTSKSKLSVGDSGCGVSTACVIYANENANLYWTYCTTPNIPDSGTIAHAQTFKLFNGGDSFPGDDPDCWYLATNYPIFVIVLNNSVSPPSSNYMHLARHELGHTLGLADALSSQSCWTEYGYLMPLMVNGNHSYNSPPGYPGNCPGYGANYTATLNEAVYAVLRSGW